MSYESGHIHEHSHNHNLDEIDAADALNHLKSDSMVLGGVGTAAVVSEVVGMSAMKTALSLGGEDAWWVVMTGRKAWQNEHGGFRKKLLSSLKATKYSLGVLVGVAAVATPITEFAITKSPDMVAASVFSASAVAISTTSMLEDKRNDRTNGRSTTAHDQLSRKFRTEGILGTFVLGYALHEQIGNGNPLAMALVGGTDCLWTATRSYLHARQNERLA